MKPLWPTCSNGVIQGRAYGDPADPLATSSAASRLPRSRGTYMGTKNASVGGVDDGVPVRTRHRLNESVACVANV
jgi:hypothetical protein